MATERDRAIDALVASGYYREDRLPDGERVAVHIENLAIASGAPRFRDDRGQIRGTVETQAIRGHFRRKGVRPCPCECNAGGFCGGCGHSGCSGGINLR